MVFPTAGARRMHANGAPTHDAISPSAHASRMSGIDAARGIAMVLVCLSHVRYYFADSAPTIYEALTLVTRLATPTFLLLSGFVAAYVLASSRKDARLALFDRGLFVLFAGHLLLNWADLGTVSAQEWLFARITVTDAIAMCLMTAALAAKLPTRVLAGIGLCLIGLSWPLALTWTPETSVGHHVAAVLFNARASRTPLTDSALVPYMGLFFLGMSLRRWCSPYLAKRAYADAARRLLVVGTLCAACVVAGIVAWHLFKPTLATLVSHDMLSTLRLTLDPRSKMPPSPAYLAFYGGGGLVIAALCLWERPAVLLQPLVKWAATLGRASLMCFVVQDWLLVLMPKLLGLDANMPSLYWWAHLTGVLLVLHALASGWDRAQANRFLTVGLKGAGGPPIARLRARIGRASHAGRPH
jgi:uncharacterized membrane protein